MDSISALTHRRLVLGQQGLWPGRRFEGLRGVSSAIRKMGALQLDPLNIVARSQDIALYSRVLDYKSSMLYKAAYERRRFFDYGGALFLYPMEELPFWRAIMGRVAASPRMRHFRENHPGAMDEVLAVLRTNGPMSNRDFEGSSLGYWSYRGRKDSAVALFYLWLLGEVMITRRKGFDRVYDLRERVAPSEHDRIAPVDEAEQFFALKAIAWMNVMREKRFRIGWQDLIAGKVTDEDAQRMLESLVEAGKVVRTRIEGSKETWITLSEYLPAIEALEAGRIPKAWKPRGPTTQEEVTLLAPLEVVSARGRAKQLFGFEYIWEVYKPVHLRRWGYYTLPVLYGDDLVARLDPRLDRQTGTLQILGFWMEEDAPRDEAFASALGRGLARFAQMAGAQKLDVSAIQPRKLRLQVKKLSAF